MLFGRTATISVSFPLFRKASVFFWGGLWLVLLSTGSALMMRYESTAGSTGCAPEKWPAASHLQCTSGRATLVMFAHPKCPCTRASVEEFAGLIAGAHEPVNVHVVFLQPTNFADDWARTALWRQASRIPGVTVSTDHDGAEAARFGSQTSGDVLLYDATGRLAFHGGITQARGEAGESDGRVALSRLLAGQLVTQARTPVFGCPLSGPCASTKNFP